MGDFKTVRLRSESQQTWTLHASLYKADDTTLCDPEFTLIPECSHYFQLTKFLKVFPKVLLFDISSYPRNREATGWMESLAVQMLYYNGCALCELLISPVDFHYLQDTALHFI